MCAFSAKCAHFTASGEIYKKDKTNKKTRFGSKSAKSGTKMSTKFETFSRSSFLKPRVN